MQFYLTFFIFCHKRFDTPSVMINMMENEKSKVKPTSSSTIEYTIKSMESPWDHHSHQSLPIFLCVGSISEYTEPHPSFYRRYVDDSFLIFNQASHINPFFSHMNSILNNIKFTKEEETEVSYFPFPFDIKITKGNGQFRTSTYYKATHTGVYTN